MLANLIKYECKASFRTLGLLYTAVIMLSVLLNPLLFRGDIPILVTTDGGLIVSLLMTAYMTVIAITSVVSIGIVALRFWRTMLGNEGYLMNTLPVPAWQHILAKLITGLLISMASGIVLLASIFIITFSADMLDWMQQLLRELGQLLGDFARYITFGDLFRLALLAVISPVLNFLRIFAASCVGHQASQHRALCALGAFFGLNMVETLLDSLLWAQFYSSRLDAHGYFSLGIMLAYALLYYALTHYLLTNRLNLE